MKYKLIIDETKEEEIIIIAHKKKEIFDEIERLILNENDNLIGYLEDEIVAKREKECRHDVMSHVYEFGLKCPNAKPIIHLGATSCFVTDNTDIILIRKALRIIKQKLLVVIKLSLVTYPTIAYTIPTTIGPKPPQIKPLNKNSIKYLFILNTNPFFYFFHFSSTYIIFIIIFKNNL